MGELQIKNLHVSAGEKQILKGVDLHVRAGEFHALMGPNGSGKSTLANAIMGHPNLEITEGQILFDGEDITEADPDERARAGLFMAFQYPVAIPGVTVAKYLRMVINAHREGRGEQAISLKDFRKTVEAAMELTKVPKEFSSRYLNDGFSGGEKKRMEILQLALTQPKLAVLDETDSGLDIDALNTVAAGRQHGLAGHRHGRADHHPLPAHPAHRQAAVRAHHVRGPDRQGGRPGARHRAREARATAGSATRSPRPRYEPHGPPSTEFPTLSREGLVYLDTAATSQTVRPALEAMDRYYETYRASIHRGIYAIASEATDAYEARAREGRRLHELHARRDDLHPQRDRGHQPRRQRVGARERRRRRPRGAHADGAPLQHRPVAAARLPAGLRAGHRRGPAGPRRARRAAGAEARSSSPSRTSPTCSGRSTRSPRSSRAPMPPARW